MIEAEGKRRFKILAPYVSDFQKYMVGMGYDKAVPIHTKWAMDLVFSPYFSRQSGGVSFDNGNLETMLIAHRGSFKTTTILLALSLLLLADGSVDVIICNANEDLAKSKIGILTSMIETVFYRDLFRKIYGIEMELVNKNKTKLRMPHCASKSGFNVCPAGKTVSGLTGRHSQVVWLDDVVNDKDYFYSKTRESSWTYYQEIQKVLNPGGLCIITGTPWHRDDLYSRLEHLKTKNKIKINIQKHPVFSLEIPHVTSEWLEQQRAKCDERTFMSQYHLQHIIPDDMPFSNSLNKFKSLREIKRYGVTKKEDTSESEVFYHIDKSFRGKDLTVLTKAVLINRKYFYVSGWAWGSSIRDSLPMIQEIIKQTKSYAGVWVETNDDNGSFADDNFRSNYIEKLFEYSENIKKLEKVDQYLTTAWKREEVFFNETDMLDARGVLVPSCKKFLDQMILWDWKRGDRQPDDAVDSLSCIIRIIRVKLQNYIEGSNKQTLEEYMYADF